MEDLDIRYVRRLHDHFGLDDRKCCLPNPAARVWCQPGRCAMGTEYLCAIAWSYNASLRLSRRPLRNQTRLSFGTLDLCDWLLPTWTRTLVGLAHRGPRPAG